jgi:hypothetical protein
MDKVVHHSSLPMFCRSPTQLILHPGVQYSYEHG